MHARDVFPGVGKVHRGVYPNEAGARLRNQPITMILVSVRDWNMNLFASFKNLGHVPMLVIIRSRLDRHESPKPGNAAAFF
jgi:hypothetical protein